MEVTVLNSAGKETSKKIKLNKEIFGIEPNDHAIYLDVKQFMANQRQGTHKAKERGEIKASNKKIKKQKGTGTARAGRISSPIFKGGGRIFGPRPRDYRFKLNKKLKQLARVSALTYKAKAEGIKIVEDFILEAPKTQEYQSVLNNLQVSDKKSLIVTNEPNKNIYLSSRNLQKTKVVTLSDLSTYDIMNCANIVFFESSINNLQKEA